MSAIKKVWITKHDGDLVVLSLESQTIEPRWMRVKVDELEFPDKSTKTRPKRHTIALSLLSVDDLELIVAAINEYLDSGGL